METIQVYPNVPSAIGMVHPHGPVLTEVGALWPQDSFTARRLVDGSITREAPEKAKAAPVASASAAAPSIIAPPSVAKPPATTAPAKPV